MKKQIKQVKQGKLELKTETLRRLDDEELAVASGGLRWLPGVSWLPQQCGH